MLLRRTRPLPYKAGQHHGLFRFAPLASSALPCATCKSKRPLSLPTSHHVLPAFARSWEGDNPSLTLPKGEGTKWLLANYLTYNVTSRSDSDAATALMLI